MARNDRSNEEIVRALQCVEGEEKVVEVCLGIGEQTLRQAR